MGEIWKDIKNYEGIYQVSNLGNVKSLDRIIISKDKKRNIRGRILHLSICPDGYFFCHLCKNGKDKNCKVHRLVAETFIKNPDKYPCINHIDGNKLNNKIENLEWSSYSHNVKEAFRLGLKKPRGKAKKK